MYFKTKKTSETGSNFTAMCEKKDESFKAAKALAKEVGMQSWRGGYWMAFGGMSSCIFKEKPDSKIWGKSQVEGEYYPKRNSKAGKAMYKRIEDLPTVSKGDLNACIGFKEPYFKTIGFSSSNDSYFGFEVGDDWNVKIPNDCVEITKTEYDKLFT